MDAHLAILVPRLGDESGRPEDRPLGRAALRACALGIPVIFATETADGCASGVLARRGRFEPVRDVPVAVIYDRFPCQSQPERHRALLEGLAQAKVANPPSLVALCRDKLAAQHALVARSVPMPEVEGDPDAFAERLQQWGAAFLKPRYGSFGEGVRRLSRGQTLPPAAQLRDHILQQAIDPASGEPYRCARVLVQRDVDEGWSAGEPIVRVSAVDPVVNAARGADVLQLSDALPGHRDAIVSVSVAAARALAARSDGSWLVEVGVDVVLSADGVPLVIEVNGRPRGRLEALAALDPGRFGALHEHTCLRPIRWLWERAR